MQSADGPAHAGLGIVLHEAHIAGDLGGAVALDHAAHRRGARLAGGDLRLQVGEVLAGIARRPATGGQGRARRVLQEQPLAHDRQGVEHDPLLVDAVRERRHGARLDAADIGMMAARRHIEFRPIAPIPEDRHDHGDVRQVGAAGERIVQREGLAGL